MDTKKLIGATVAALRERFENAATSVNTIRCRKNVVLIVMNCGKFQTKGE